MVDKVLKTFVLFLSLFAVAAETGRKLLISKCQPVTKVFGI